MDLLSETIFVGGPPDPGAKSASSGCLSAGLPLRTTGPDGLLPVFCGVRGRLRSLGFANCSELTGGGLSRVVGIGGGLQGRSLTARRNDTLREVFALPCALFASSAARYSAGTTSSTRNQVSSDLPSLPTEGGRGMSFGRVLYCTRAQLLSLTSSLVQPELHRTSLKTSKNCLSTWMERSSRGWMSHVKGGKVFSKALAFAATSFLCCSDNRSSWLLWSSALRSKLRSASRNVSRPAKPLFSKLDQSIVSCFFRRACRSLSARKCQPMCKEAKGS